MANVQYQSYQPSAPPSQTLIKTTGDDTTGHIQHIAIDDAIILLWWWYITGGKTIEYAE